MPLKSKRSRSNAAAVAKAHKNAKGRFDKCVEEEVEEEEDCVHTYIFIS